VSGEDFHVLAEEQAALRRVATLVARGAPPEELFPAVTEEVGRVLHAEMANMGRYETDTVVIVGSVGGHVPVGARVTFAGKNIGALVFETGRSVRFDNYAEATGPGTDRARELGVRSAVGVPIIVEDRVWGVINVASTKAKPLPADTEERLGSFTELVAMAISNTEARAELAASRARIVAAADASRRQIQRDLHDGAQQQLVNLILELKVTEPAALSEESERMAYLARMERGLAGALEELQEISRGLHPAALSKNGLEPALTALAHRSAVRVELDVRLDGRLPEPLEVAVYYVVSEALTNVVKHARASVVQVELDAQDAVVRLAISDDGVGGAERGRGSGLVGLSDRVEACGGTVRVASPAGSGTTLLVQLPLDEHASRAPGADKSAPLGHPVSGRSVRRT
jgi:signal transduction histidine kinase